MLNKIRIHIFVSGLVQGVFFRYRIKKMAEAFEILGFVKNLKDGRVEAIFEGEEESLERLIAWIKSSPKGTSVKKVDIFYDKQEQIFENFEIK